MLDALKKQEFILNEFAADERGLVGWKITSKKAAEGENPEEILYTEELTAMLLKFGRQLSEKQAGGTIKDCVITVPSYFTPS